MSNKDKSYTNITEDLLAFIEESPSAYHVIDNITNILDKKSFTRLSESEDWSLEYGKNYYVVRGGSSIIAFKLPEGEFDHFQIVASHSDSPSFKIKENPEISVADHYVQLNVEKYGGMIMSPWFDRPLSIAGRVVVKVGNTFDVRLVDVGRDICMIPNMAIHMNREINEGYKYNAQKDMLPIFGDETSKDKFIQVIADAVKVDETEIVSYDLFLYNRVNGTIWGANEEFVSSTKLDDLQCAYASLKGFIAGENDNNISVYCVFDNEEVGSTTKQGADSTFLADVLTRVVGACDRPIDDYYRLLAGSFMLSADNAHAAHPSHLDKADPTNKPFMNNGIVIKYNANQKYTTDSISAAIFKGICDRANVPYQSYVNRSDVPGGSTLGNISNSHVSLNTVDIGLAQLAMHSPYETAGVKDTDYMLRAIREFYNTNIVKKDDNTFVLE